MNPIPNPLNETAYLSTMSEPMTNVTLEADEAVDIWPYVEAIPAKEIGGLLQDVEYVWRDALQRYDHVLIATSIRNVFLAVIIDLKARSVFGHRLLDLNREYGLTPG